ncbi:hypothetical protein C2E23DRAFT_495602 [Lenzites betulinus]|nr:hypothetical protein C2E23DRAFT_495602 [Lenzites betulinus]
MGRTWVSLLLRLCRRHASDFYLCAASSIYSLPAAAEVQNTRVFQLRLQNSSSAPEYLSTPPGLSRSYSWLRRREQTLRAAGPLTARYQTSSGDTFPRAPVLPLHGCRPAFAISVPGPTALVPSLNHSVKQVFCQERSDIYTPLRDLALASIVSCSPIAIEAVNVLGRRLCGVPSEHRSSVLLRPLAATKHTSTALCGTQTVRRDGDTDGTLSRCREAKIIVARSHLTHLLSGFSPAARVPRAFEP